MRKLGRIAKHVLAMRTVLAIFLLLSAACAKHEAEPITCVQEPGAQQVAYPDGQSRKSYVAQCSDGCVKFTSVAYGQVGFNSCERW